MTDEQFAEKIQNSKISTDYPPEEQNKKIPENSENFTNNLSLAETKEKSNSEFEAKFKNTGYIAAEQLEQIM